MKKIIILGLVLLMVVVFATTVLFAIAQEGIGAVKVVLTERREGDGSNDPGSGDPAGWAIINTTADGKLQVQVHMYNAPEGTYDLYVCTSPPYRWNLYVLTTNENGIGNAHVELDIPEYNLEIEQLEVKVVVKIGSGGAIVGYTNGLTEVPLKK